MSIRTLHPNQQRILHALQTATSSLQMSEHVTIVGSVGRFLAGQTKRVGDIDIFVDSDLCRCYWDFIEILCSHGLTPAFDLIDKPPFPWKCCYPTIIAHAYAFTVDCHAHLQWMQTGNFNLKHANLDICIKASDLEYIERSTQWVHWLNRNDLDKLNEAAKAQRIAADHQQLIKDLKRSEKELGKREFYSELQLYYKS